MIGLTLSTRFEVKAAPDDIVRTISFKTAYGTSVSKETITISRQSLSYWESAAHNPATLEYPNGNIVLDFSQYVDTKSVEKISVSIASVAQLGEEDVADTVLSFAQNVGYVQNDYTSDNTLYPLETLATGGVCDDLSVLYASMMIAIGFKVIFIWYAKITDLGGSEIGHVNVGIHLAEPPEHSSEGVSYFTYKGLDYYVAETTSNAWRIGDIPKSLRGQSDYVEEAPAPVTKIVMTTAATTLTLMWTRTATSTSTKTTWTEIQQGYGTRVIVAALTLVVAIASIVAYQLGKRKGRSIPRPSLHPATGTLCPSCRTANKRTAIYCRRCGARLR